MNEAFRLSRIRAPRSSAAALILLAVVLMAIGLVLSALAPEASAAAPRIFPGSATSFANWLLTEVSR